MGLLDDTVFKKEKEKKGLLDDSVFNPQPTPEPKADSTRTAPQADFTRTAQPQQEQFDYKTFATERANELGVDPNVILGIIQAESSGGKNLIGPKTASGERAKGHMQLMTPAIKDINQRLGGNVQDPLDPRQNIDGGIRYFKWLQDQFDGDTKKALAAYNAGIGKVQKYGGVPPFPETQNYVKKIYDFLGPQTAEAESPKKGLLDDSVFNQQQPQRGLLDDSVFSPKEVAQPQTRRSGLGALAVGQDPNQQVEDITVPLEDQIQASPFVDQLLQGAVGLNLQPQDEEAIRELQEGRTGASGITGRIIGETFGFVPVFRGAKMLGIGTKSIKGLMGLETAFQGGKLAAGELAGTDDRSTFGKLAEGGMAVGSVGALSYIGKLAGPHVGPIFNSAVNKFRKFTKSRPIDKVNLDDIVVLDKGLQKPGNVQPQAIPNVRPELQPATPTQKVASNAFDPPRALNQISDDVVPQPSKVTDPAFKPTRTKKVKSAIDVERARKEIFPEGAADSIEEGSQKAQAVFEVARRESHRIAKERTSIIRKIKRGFGRTILDQSRGVKKKLEQLGPLGEEVKARHAVVKGSSGRVKLRTKQLVDPIYEGLTKDEKLLLDEVVQSKAMVDTMNRIERQVATRQSQIDELLEQGGKSAAKQVKQLKREIKDLENILHPGDQPKWVYESRLADLQRKNPELYGKLDQKAEQWFEAARTGGLNRQLEAGIIDEGTYNLLKDNRYQPRVFIQHLDPDNVSSLGADTSRRITVGESGIQKLDTGSTNALELDSEALLFDLINRTENRVLRNEANKGLLQIAREMPDNGVVSINPNPGKAAPTGFQKVNVRENGQTVEMLMPNNYADEWITSDSAIANGLGDFLRITGGSDITRAGATGINPSFAVANIPRDIAQQFFTDTSGQRSMFFPVFMKQLTDDVVDVFPNVIKKSGGWYDEAMDAGVDMFYLTRQGGGGNLGRFSVNEGLATRVGKLKGGWRGLSEILGYGNEVSEELLRVALYRRARLNGHSMARAAEIAREYLDFNVGGSWVKAIDKGAPYLNAATQGFRQIAGSARKKPGEFMFRTAQFLTVAHGLAWANNQLYGDAIDKVKPHVRRRNLVFLLPWKFKNERGQLEQASFKIPVGDQLGLLAEFSNIVMKAATRGISELEVQDAKDLGEAFVGAIPFNPDQLIMPTYKAMIQYVSNYDLFRGREISPRKGSVRPEDEFTPGRTNQFFIDVGQKTGLSPDRLENAAQTVLPGNIYTDLLGGGYLALTQHLDKETRGELSRMLLQNSPHKRLIDMVNLDLTTEDFEDISRIKQTIGSQREEVNRALEDRLKRFDEGELKHKDIRDFIRHQPREERRRLARRAKVWMRMNDQPLASFIFSSSNLSPEGRAQAFMNKYRELPEERRKLLVEGARAMPSYMSGRFGRELQRLEKQQGINVRIR